MPFVVTIQCDVTDDTTLAKEARRLAREAGVSDQEFDHYRRQAVSEAGYDLQWFFDHGSPLEFGIQIEQTDVEVL